MKNVGGKFPEVLVRLELGDGQSSGSKYKKDLKTAMGETGIRSQTDNY